MNINDFRRPFLSAVVLLFVILGVGVYANTQITLNSGNALALGAGNGVTGECDPSVDIQPIIFNDGSNVYIQGFEYDNVDKAACVGYDIETRFIDNSNIAMPLFATSSISSTPDVLRVFAPTASSNWQLGLGAVPSAEVTITQVSSSSFKAIFSTPIALVSNLGNIVMAELTHLPIGTFTNGFTQVGSVTGVWYGSCLVANNSRFYALESGSGLYQSSLIPPFPGSVASVTTSLVSSPGIPTSGVTWYALGCSANGQYLAIGGTNNQISFSKDFGSSWETRTVTSFDVGSGGPQAGIINAISISADGKVVAVSTGSNNPGYANFWVNGNFWTSGSTAPDGVYSVYGGLQTVKVCGAGTTIYGGGKSGSAGLYRWQSSSISSGGSMAPISPANTSLLFGPYIRDVGCSSDGQSAVISSPSNYQVYVTRDRFVHSYSPTGLSTTNQSATTKPYAVAMSANGQFVAIGTGDQLVTDKGTTQYSTDFGQTLTDTSFTNHYMQTITIADDGSRLITGGGVGSTKFIILGSN